MVNNSSYVATRVDDATGVFVDDQELVGLHRLTASLVRQVGEHQAHMALMVVQLNGHASNSRE
jgi:hypothetical protein